MLPISKILIEIYLTLIDMPRLPVMNGISTTADAIMWIWVNLTNLPKEYNFQFLS